MSDPLLTTLCGICRAVPPRYRCPRCGIRYCSVECSRRHRARAGCSGIRDVTAYVPRADLCTPAGVDHDYNFLRGIELARQRNERHLVEERHLLRSGDLRPPVLGEDDQRGGRNTRGGGSYRGSSKRPGGQQSSAAAAPAMVLQKQWHGDELRFVPVVDRRGAAAKVVNGSSHGGPSKKVRTLCDRDGIELLGVPMGLSRQRENNTTVATLMASGAGKRGQTAAKAEGQVHLHWQVEWLVYEDGLTAKPTRVLRRLLDHVPLCRGYAAMMAWVLQQTGGIVDEDVGSSRRNQGHANEDGGPKLQVKKRRIHLLAQPSKNKKRRTAGGLAARPDQGLGDFAATYAWQDPKTGAWDGRTDEDESPDEDEDGDEQDDQDEDEAVTAARRDMLFFLLRPRLPTAKEAGAENKTTAPPPPAGKELIPLLPGDTLATALPGRAVLEFPTICVLRRGDADMTGGLVLPPGHVLGSTARKVVHAGTPMLGGLSASVAVQATEDSDTSSSGTTSSEESGEDDDDASDKEDEDGADSKMADAADIDPDLDSDAEDGLPLLRGLNGGSKSRLVVYDSWSEASGDEGSNKRPKAGKKDKSV